MISARFAAAAGSAVVFVAARMHPVGIPVVDVALSVALGAVIVVAGMRAGALMVLIAWAPVVAVAAGAPGIAAAVVGVVASVAAALCVQRFATLGRFLLLVACVALVVGITRLRDVLFAGSSAAAAALAVVVLLLSGWWSLAAPWRRRVGWVLACVGSVLVVVVALAGLAALNAKASMADARRDLQEAVRLVRRGDTQEGRTLLRRARAEVGDARDWLAGPWQQPARVLPVVAQNLRASEAVAAAVERATGELDGAADAAGLHGLGVHGGTIDLDAVAEMARQLADVAAAVQRVDDIVRAQSSPWLVGRLRTELRGVRDTIGEVETDLVHARDALTVLPALMGVDGDRRYLVMFVAPSESRGGGGFPGQNAEVLVHDGHIELGRQTRSSDLIEPAGAHWTLTGLDEYLARYGNFRVESDWRNVTMSPDFPTVATAARQLYAQATGVQVDGVLRIGPQALTAMLKLTGPISVDGLSEPLTAKNAFSFFTRGQYDGRFANNDARVDVLTQVVERVIDRLTSMDFPDPRSLGDVLSPVIAAGDFAFWSAETNEQAAIVPLGIAGAVPDAGRGDSLFVTQHNLLTNKIDAWSERHIDYTLDVDRPAGTVAGTFGLTFTNTAPDHGADLQFGNEAGLPTGTMRELLTIYSPDVLDDFRIDGEPVNVLLQSELGRLAYVVQIEVAPGSSVTITAEVSGTLVAPDGVYRLVMPVVPAVNPDTATITNNGVTTRHTFTSRLLVISR